MKELIESVAFEGTRLTVTVRLPFPVDAAALAVATAIRVFERYAVMDRVAVVSEAGEVSLSRDQVERPFHSDGLGALQDPRQWRQALARAMQAFLLGEADLTLGPQALRSSAS